MLGRLGRRRSLASQRVNSMDSISRLCEKTGAEVSEGPKAIDVDTRIGS